MKKVTLFILLLVSFVGFSQEEEKVENNNKEKNKVYISVEKYPEYPDKGMNGFREFIAQNYRLPKVPIDLKGNVILTFIVETDGSLTDIEVVRDLGFGTGVEAVRVLKKSRKRIPGVQLGRPVRV